MEPIAPGVFVAILAAVTLAGFVQGASSFGFAIVAMAVVPFFLPPKVAVAVVAVCGPFVSAGILLSLRGKAEWSLVVPLAASAILVGLPVGTLTLSYIDPDSLRLVIGVVLIASGLMVALRRPPSPGDGDRAGSESTTGSVLWALLAGAAAGVLGGLASMIGPFVVIFMSGRPLDKHRISATQQAVFAATASVRLPMLYAAGLLDAERLRWGLALSGGAVLGCLVGVAVFRRLPARTLRRAVAALILLAGVRQAWTGAAGMRDGNGIRTGSQVPATSSAASASAAS